MQIKLFVGFMLVFLTGCGASRQWPSVHYGQPSVYARTPNEPREKVGRVPQVLVTVVNNSTNGYMEVNASANLQGRGAATFLAPGEMVELELQPPRGSITGSAQIQVAVRVYGDQNCTRYLGIVSRPFYLRAEPWGYGVSNLRQQRSYTLAVDYKRGAVTYRLQ